MAVQSMSESHPTVLDNDKKTSKVAFRKLEFSRPHPNPSFPTPKLRFSVNDLNHAGAKIFFRNTNPSAALSEAVDAVLSILYQSTKTNSHIPPTRSVTLILECMDGVAYTKGMDLDSDHKEIHFSLDYINQIKSERRVAEIQGVLVHEMVHWYADFGAMRF